MVMLNLFQYLFKRDSEINSEWQKDNNHKRLFTNQTVMLNLFQHLFLLDSEILLNYCFTLRSRSFYLLCKYYSLCSVLLRVSDCVLTPSHKTILNCFVRQSVAIAVFACLPHWPCVNTAHTGLRFLNSNSSWLFARLFF